MAAWVRTGLYVDDDAAVSLLVPRTGSRGMSPALAGAVLLGGHC